MVVAIAVSVTVSIPVTIAVSVPVAVAACACAVEHDAHVMELLLAVEPFDVGQLTAVEHAFAHDIDTEVGQTVRNHRIGYRHGRRAVNEYEVVTLLQLLYQLVEPVREQHLGGVGRLYAGADHVEVLVEAHVRHQLVDVGDRSGQITGHAVLAVAASQVRRERVTAQVEVYQHDPFARHGQRHCQIHRHERLARMGVRRGEEHALDFLADVSNGDARAALTAIELGVLTTDRSDDGIIHITIDVASECIQKRVISYDKKGDNHYDTISAFIKSMRGSDPDAAVYYLARMLYAGEDVKFIARRIMILASEDIGNADPMAMVVAASAAAEVERVGMPEAQIILSQAVTYMACAPKSNASYNAISAAMSCVKQTKTPAVPAHLQDAHYGAAEKLGHGVGYKYAHDYPNHYVKQQYLPDGLTDRVFYKPTDIGYEAKIKAHMDELHRDCDT